MHSLKEKKKSIYRPTFDTKCILKMDNGFHHYPHRVSKLIFSKSIILL